MKVVESNSFKKIEKQPLQKLNEGMAFVTFERLHYDARAIFLSNWIRKVDKDQVNPFGQRKQKLKGSKAPEERPTCEKNPSKKKKIGSPAIKNRRLIHWVFLNKFNMFLTVSFGALHSQVTAVCERDICRDAVVEILKDLVLDGLAENSNPPSVE